MWSSWRCSLVVAGRSMGKPRKVARGTSGGRGELEATSSLSCIPRARGASSVGDSTSDRSSSTRDATAVRRFAATPGLRTVPVPPITDGTVVPTPTITRVGRVLSGIRKRMNIGMEIGDKLSVRSRRVCAIKRCNAGLRIETMSPFGFRKNVAKPASNKGVID